MGRWPVRRDFARAAKLSLSTVEHIERGEPKQYQAATRDKIERTLHWVHGDFERILEGGSPTPGGDLQYVMDSWPHLDEQARAIIVQLVTEALRAGSTRGRRRR